MALAFALALGLTAAATPITVTFQNGRSPSTAYSGIEEVRIREGENEPWDAGANYDGVDLEMDSFPVKKSALIRWRLDGLPPSSAIASASLTLEAFGASNSPIQIYECLADWSEAEATFNQRMAGRPWSSPGASAPGVDRGAAVLGEIGNGGAGARTVPLNDAGVAVIQAWVNGTPNRGLVLQNYSELAGDGLDLRCSETPIAGERPALTVQLVDGGTWRFQNGISPSSGYTGTSDTTLAHGPPPDGNADGFGLALGGTPQSHVLIRYDLSAIPAGMRVGAATLGFEVADPSTDSYPIAPLLRPWVETGASWTTSDGAAPWELAGAQGPGDRQPAGATPLRFPGTGPSFHRLDDGGVAALESWLGGTAPNHGFAISSTASAGLARLHDGEAQDPGQRPSLILALIPDDGGLRLFPARADALAGSPVQFQAVGGTPPYRFQLSRSGSGGAVGQDSGGYLAGPVAGVDEVQVTDSASQTQTGTVRVLCAGPGCGGRLALDLVELDPPPPVVAAGDRLRLRMEVRDATDAGEPGPWLRVEGGGFLIVDARVEDGPVLALDAGGYALPALGAGGWLRLRVEGRVTARPGEPVEVTAVVDDARRAEASNRADASWVAGPPQLSTGCGCSSAGGALAWAAGLSLAAAAQRGRRRRAGRAIPISSERSMARAEWVSAPMDT